MSHIINVHVENKPGVLARVSAMFARRGFNIQSLTVGPTADPTLSRMTIVIDGPKMEQVIKQLYKLIHVVKVTELKYGEGIEREVILLRISAEKERRGEILAAANIFKASTVDVGVNTLTFELTAAPDKLTDFLELMRPYGIIDLAQSGRIALRKDPKIRDGHTKLRSA